MLTSASAAPAAATLPLFLPQAPPDKVSGLIHAATLLAQLLGQGRALDSRALRSAMETAFCGTDAEGAWVWKDAYEALEAAQVLFLRKFGGAMRTRAGSAAAMLEMLTRLAGRLPSQTRRSEESEHFQQFSTPIALGFVAAEAAALTAADLVLEPSAGTGLAGDLRRTRQSPACAERDRRHARRIARPPVPRRRGHPPQRRADPRPARSRDPAERGSDEPALLGLAACRGALCRSRDAPCRLGARASRRRRTARRHHRPQCRSRSAGLARQLRAPAGERPRRLHRDDRRPGLCPPRYEHRDPADGHRPRSGRGPARLSALAGNGRRCRRAPRSGLPPGPAARCRSQPPLPSPAPAMFPRPAAAVARPKAPRRSSLSSNARRRSPDVVEISYETRDWTPGSIRPPYRQPL